jgi:hypothetical protein
VSLQVTNDSLVKAPERERREALKAKAAKQSAKPKRSAAAAEA